jgi:hypothetical protein
VADDASTRKWCFSMPREDILIVLAGVVLCILGVTIAFWLLSIAEASWRHGPWRIPWVALMFELPV